MNHSVFIQTVDRVCSLLVLVMVAFLLFSGPAFAKMIGSFNVDDDDTVGVYIAPKMVYSLQNVSNVSESYDIGDIASWTENYNGSDNKSAFGGGIAVGYDFMPLANAPIRTELEYMARSEAKINGSYDWGLGFEQNTKVKWSVQTLFANLYLDLHTNTPLRPYVGAGAGLAFVKGKLDDSMDEAGVSVSSTETQTNFAWNVGAGTAFIFSDHVALDLGYRYADFGSMEISGTTGTIIGDITSKREADLAAHEVLMGLRFGF